MRPPTRRIYDQAQHDRAQHHRAEATLIRRATAWLRNDPDRGVRAGLGHDVEAMAALLDILATELIHVAPEVRQLAAQSCQSLLEAGAADPTRTEVISTRSA
jgi:hypothetical protein